MEYLQLLEAVQKKQFRAKREGKRKKIRAKVLSEAYELLRSYFLVLLHYFSSREPGDCLLLFLICLFWASLFVCGLSTGLLIPVWLLGLQQFPKFFTFSEYFFVSIHLIEGDFGVTLLY